MSSKQSGSGSINYDSEQYIADMKAAVLNLFNHMKIAYVHKFNSVAESACPAPNTQASIRLYAEFWFKELFKLQIDPSSLFKVAVPKLSVEHKSYPPTVYEFAELCRFNASAESLKLLPVRKAYELCALRDTSQYHQMQLQELTPQARLLMEKTGYDVGYTNLKSKPERDTYPEFKKAYEENKQVLLSGGELNLPRITRSDQLITKQAPTAEQKARNLQRQRPQLEALKSLLGI